MAHDFASMQCWWPAAIKSWSVCTVEYSQQVDPQHGEGRTAAGHQAE